ncbi:MAG TPA: hypothetical protein VMW95_02755, partial [Desulfobacterales bacterium]|nr:hypothetical protein [Desulfobacterales bacterium]
ETAEDFEDILNLDESLWVATSAPAQSFRSDPKLIEFLDSDESGRINTNKLKNAIRWLLDSVIEKNYLTNQVENIPLSIFNINSPSGNALVSSALYVLKMLGMSEQTSISLSQVRQFQANAKQVPLNGDGVIIPESTSELELKNFIIDVIKCTGGTVDISGKQGVSEQNIHDFMDALNGYLAWKKKGEILDGNKATDIMPFGTDTPTIYTIYAAHASKIDAFFSMCRALHFEPRVLSKIGFRESDLEGLNLSQIDSLNIYLKNEPLAQPTNDGNLPLTEESINPYYLPWILMLKEKVLKIVLGNCEQWLKEEEWLGVKSALAPYEEYLSQQKWKNISPVPMKNLITYRYGDMQNKIIDLIKTDKDVAIILKKIKDLEKFLLYSMFLIHIVNNFVSFTDLYSPMKRALFEMGSVVIDGRWFNFAVKVDNLTSHSTIARMSNLFLMYLEITGKTEAEKFAIAVPATSGSKGNLTQGKRGIFFDTEGKEYDARVIQIIENPISISEALITPFVRLWQFVLGKIEAISSATEKDMQKKADDIIQAPSSQAKEAKLSNAPGLLVSLSISVAAMGTAFAFITKTLTGMSRSQSLFSFLGAILIVGIPVTIIAIAKLRRQNLSAILEASGWAINANMRPSRQQRRQFTYRVPYPEYAGGTPRFRLVHIVIILFTIFVLAFGSYYSTKIIVKGMRNRNIQSTLKQKTVPQLEEIPENSKKKVK